MAAVAQFTVPAGCNQAVVQADGGGTIAVRFKLDGTTPTNTSGFLIPGGQSITLSAADAAAKFVGGNGRHGQRYLYLSHFRISLMP